LETKHDVWEQLQQEIEISKAQNIVISSEFFTYPKRFFDNTNPHSALDDVSIYT
jgi:hypothetical protein